jgi:uncharacterized protein YukE
MTGFIGMDPAAVRALAGQLNAKADEIRTIATNLSSTLEHTQWVGNDATNFRGDWNSSHRTQLMNVADALSEASTRATSNAEQQEQASNA